MSQIREVCGHDIRRGQVDFRFVSNSGTEADIADRQRWATISDVQFRGNESPESGGKTGRRLLLGAPITCSLQRAWHARTGERYLLRSPGNFTKLLGEIQ